MSDTAHPGQPVGRRRAAEDAFGPVASLDGPFPAESDEDADRPSVAGLRVGRLLGRGGSSSVWLVTDDGGRRFALKVARTPPPEGAAIPGPAASRGERRRGRRAAEPLDPVFPADPDGTGDGGGHGGDDAGEMEQELRFLQRFTHEHLLRVHRLIDTDRGTGLLMDLAQGGSLLGLVTSRGPLPIPEVVTALVPVAQVLDHLHGAGALHGDVTPANILFTHEGKPLLGDLGTARLLGSAAGAVAGTAGFIDPARKGTFDAGTDVFALAAVAWFALTGRVPGPTEQRPPLALIVPEVPAQLVQLIEDGLGDDRERRPTPDDFAGILLGSAAPVPISLVGAVHASVLPELLTRRTDTPQAVPRPRWGRRTDVRAGTRRAGPRNSGRDRRPAGTAQPPPGRRTPAARPSGREVLGPRGRRMRAIVAIVAGLAAAVLLVAGIASTLGGFPAPEAGSGGRTAAGVTGPEGPGAPPDPFGADQHGAPDGGTGDEDGQEEGREGSAEADRQEARPEADSGAHDDPSRDPSRSSDPAAALAQLAALRATAFATADPGVLAAVDVEGSPAMSADQEAVTALAGAGRILRDLSIAIRDPTVLTGAELQAVPAVAALPAVSSPPAATEVAVIRATATLSSYTETPAEPPGAGTGPPEAGTEPPGTAAARRGADMARPDAQPGPLMAAGQQELVFILWETEPGWRIHSVVSVPDG